MKLAATFLTSSQKNLEEMPFGEVTAQCFSSWKLLGNSWGHFKGDKETKSIKYKIAIWGKIL